VLASDAVDKIRPLGYDSWEENYRLAKLKAKIGPEWRWGHCFICHIVCHRFLGEPEEYIERNNIIYQRGEEEYAFI